MQPNLRPFTHPLTLISLILIALSIACVRSAPAGSGWERPATSAVQPSSQAAVISTQAPVMTATRDPRAPIMSPTPDAPHILPTPRQETETYFVQAGDSLGRIAQRYGVDVNALVSANDLANPNLLEVGQQLTIPAAQPLPAGPDFKIIPDSELVYSPASIGFDVANFIQAQAGYLANYHQDVDGVSHSGTDVVIRIAQEYSVNPRLLLALLEYQSNWVTRSDPPSETLDYPIRYNNSYYRGLYIQLAWAANNLNRGYYLWKVNALTGWILPDGALVPPSPVINAGTAGVQHLFSLLYDRDGWDQAVTAGGLFSTYRSFFGYPFDLAIEPLVPANLQQPFMQLPFEKGTVWSFTGGPHGGWGNGSAWAALDFAPPADALGCFVSNEWVVAVADGVITRAENGAVVQELDGDGAEQTGWSVLYMHIATQDRIRAGVKVQAGERIGHPSCEGGVSNGTHVHLARRYNGEWISADGDLPFDLEGWVSSGDGIEYNGWLTRGGASVEAWDARKDENQIGR